MIYGIQASKDIKLSIISRALKEDITLIKTEDCLSRNLSSEDLTGEINDQLMRLADDKTDKDMVIAIDPGDLMKPYAKSISLDGSVMNVTGKSNSHIILKTSGL